MMQEQGILIRSQNRKRQVPFRAVDHTDGPRSTGKFHEFAASPCNDGCGRQLCNKLTGANANRTLLFPACLTWQC
jgi:hypothetical protein